MWDYLWTGLRWIYLHGPGWLMWGGLRQSEVCAHMTGVGEFHWEREVQLCEALVDRKAVGFAIGTVLVGGVWAVLWLTMGMCVRYTVIRPICDTLVKRRDGTTT
jgi:hypothetical protein